MARTFPGDTLDAPYLVPDVFGDEEMENAVFGHVQHTQQLQAPTPMREESPEWMAQCASFIAQLQEHPSMPCCNKVLSEAQLDQVEASFSSVVAYDSV